MADGLENMNDELLVKYLNKETSEYEDLAVQSWLESSEENRSYYADLERLWNYTGTTPDIQVDTDAAWAKLSERIEEYKNAKTPIIRRLNNWQWMAAAAVVILGMLGIFRWSTSPKEVQLASTDEIIIQELPDGSEISLNANSEISYPKKFKGETRKVVLKGEAYFAVEPDPEKPFIVETEVGVIKVLGTKFNVEAYHDSTLKVYVTEGLVQVSSPSGSADSTSILLEAGNTGIIDYRTNAVYKDIPLAEDATFWLDKKLVFNKTPLPQVLKILEKNYKIEFSTFGDEIEDCLLTARFEGEDINSILEVISATFNIRFKLESGIIKVTAEDVDCTDA